MELFKLCQTYVLPLCVYVFIPSFYADIYGLISILFIYCFTAQVLKVCRTLQPVLG